MNWHFSSFFIIFKLSFLNISHYHIKLTITQTFRKSTSSVARSINGYASLYTTYTRGDPVMSISNNETLTTVRIESFLCYDLVSVRTFVTLLPLL